MNKNQTELKNEVEIKLDCAERIYSEREYYMNLGDEVVTKNKAERIKRLGYKVVKRGNAYKISE